MTSIPAAHSDIIAIAKHIKDRRQSLGIEIAALSKNCNIPVDQLIDAENGSHALSVDEVQRLSEALCIPVEIPHSEDDAASRRQKQLNELSVQGLILNRSFMAIENENLRLEIINLAALFTDIPNDLSDRTLQEISAKFHLLKKSLIREIGAE